VGAGGPWRHPFCSWASVAVPVATLCTPLLTYLATSLGSRHKRPGHPGPLKAQCRNNLGHPCDDPKHHFGTSGEPAASCCSILASVSMSFLNLFCKGLVSKKHAICYISATFSSFGPPLRCRLAPFAHLFRHIWSLLSTLGSRHKRPDSPWATQSAASERPLASL